MSWYWLIYWLWGGIDHKSHSFRMTVGSEWAPRLRPINKTISSGAIWKIVPRHDFYFDTFFLSRQFTSPMQLSDGLMSDMDNMRKINILRSLQLLLFVRKRGIGSWAQRLCSPLPTSLFVHDCEPICQGRGSNIPPQLYFKFIMVYHV